MRPTVFMQMGPIILRLGGELRTEYLPESEDPAVMMQFLSPLNGASHMSRGSDVSSQGGWPIWWQAGRGQGEAPQFQ